MGEVMGVSAASPRRVLLGMRAWCARGDARTPCTHAKFYLSGNDLLKRYHLSQLFPKNSKLSEIYEKPNINPTIVFLLSSILQNLIRIR